MVVKPHLMRERGSSPLLTTNLIIKIMRTINQIKAIKANPQKDVKYDGNRCNP